MDWQVNGWLGVILPMSMSMPGVHVSVIVCIRVRVLVRVHFHVRVHASVHAIVHVRVHACDIGIDTAMPANCREYTKSCETILRSRRNCRRDTLTLQTKSVNFA
jgi:hypothetical protein